MSLTPTAILDNRSHALSTVGTTSKVSSLCAVSKARSLVLHCFNDYRTNVQCETGMRFSQAISGRNRIHASSEPPVGLVLQSYAVQIQAQFTLCTNLQQLLLARRQLLNSLATANFSNIGDAATPVNGVATLVGGNVTLAGGMATPGGITALAGEGYCPFLLALRRLVCHLSDIAVVMYYQQFPICGVGRALAYGGMSTSFR